MLLRQPPRVGHLARCRDPRSETPRQLDDRRKRGRSPDPPTDTDHDLRGYERRRRRLAKRPHGSHPHAGRHPRDGKRVDGCLPPRGGASGGKDARTDRRHLRTRARQDGRHDDSPEGRLVLADAVLGVDIEVDRIAGETEAEPCGHPRGEIAAPDGRAEEDEAGRSHTDRLGEDRGVCVRRVRLEGGIVRHEHAVGARSSERGRVHRAGTDHDRLDPSAEARREVGRLGEELGRDRSDALAARLHHHPDARTRTRRAPGKRPSLVAALQRPEIAQACRKRPRLRFRAVARDELPAPCDLDGLHAGDPRGRPCRSHLFGRDAEVGHSERRDRLRRCGLALDLGREALFGQVFRGRHDGRERAGHRLEPLVGLALRRERPGRIDLEAAGTGHLRQIEELGDLGTDLAGLGIRAGTPEEDHVGRLAAERARQRVGGC